MVTYETTRVEGTGFGLLLYLDSEAARDHLNGLTRSTYKTACRRLLEALPAGMDSNLRALDLTNAQRAFEESKVGGGLAAETRGTYISSFKAAVRAYLRYLDERGGRGGPEDAAAFVTHKFPLRSAYVVELPLPSDLTSSEADRLCAFVHSLVLAG